MKISAFVLSLLGSVFFASAAFAEDTQPAPAASESAPISTESATSGSSDSKSSDSATDEAKQDEEKKADDASGTDAASGATDSRG